MEAHRSYQIQFRVVQSKSELRNTLSSKMERVTRLSLSFWLGLVTVLVALTADSTQAKDRIVEFNTPDFECVKDGIFPNPHDCATFYKCQTGLAYLYDCPDTTLFHKDYLVCVFPENAECAVPEPVPEPTTTEEPTTTARPTTARPTTTEEPTTHAPTTTERVTTTRKPRPTTTRRPRPTTTRRPRPTTTTTEEPAAGFNCDGREEGKYANPESCFNFYVCVDGHPAPYLMDCAAEGATVFNPATGDCDWPENVEGCGGDAPAPGPGDDFDCVGKPSGLYPNPSDCRSFYYCVDGHPDPYLTECPADLFFNPELLVCDWPENVPSCGEAGTTAAPTTTARPTRPPTTTRRPRPTRPPTRPTRPPTTTSRPTRPPTRPTRPTRPTTTTAEPEPPTEAPTDAPEEPTEAPEEPTEAPEEPTEAPEEPTEAPEEPTEAPEEPTTEDPDCSSSEEDSSSSSEEDSSSSEEDTPTEPPTQAPTTTKRPKPTWPTLPPLPTWPTFPPWPTFPTRPPPTTTTTTTTTTEAPTTTKRPKPTWPTLPPFPTWPTLPPFPTFPTFPPWPTLPTRPPKPTTTTTQEPEPEPTDAPTEAPTEEPTTEGEPEEPTDAPTEAPTTTRRPRPTTTRRPRPTTTRRPRPTRPTTTTTTTTEAPAPGFTCDGKEAGEHPNPEDCTSFYYCVDGHPGPILTPCPAGLYFNPVLLVCDWPEASGCVPPAPTTTTQAPTTAPPAGPFNCDGRPEGLYPNPESCFSFYYCVTGHPNAYLENCPSAGDVVTVYNPSTQRCDWPENVEGCGAPAPTTTRRPRPTRPSTARPTRPPRPTTTKAPPADDFSCDGRKEGIYANPADCTTFYYCVDGHPAPYLRDCAAEGAIFYNPATEQCDYPENVPSCSSSNRL